MRRFGFKAYYGDATRMDLLESAGAARARLLVVAIDDAGGGDAHRCSARASASPTCRLIVRARSRTDAFEYAEMGVPAVREMFGSALDAAERGAARARLSAPRRRAASCSASASYDEEQIAAGSAPHRNDVKTADRAATQQGRRDLEQLLPSALAPQIHQRDAGGDEQRGEREVRAERL